MNTKPKFEIGETVFYLDCGKVKSDYIQGIITLYSRKHNTFTADEYNFPKFRYYVKIQDSIQTYGWMDDTCLFRTKEELIASL